MKFLSERRVRWPLGHFKLLVVAFLLVYVLFAGVLMSLHTHGNPASAIGVMDAAGRQYPPLSTPWLNHDCLICQMIRTGAKILLTAIVALTVAWTAVSRPIPFVQSPPARPAIFSKGSRAPPAFLPI